MKQLIFTLVLLPFLTTYPADNAANASADANASDADVKISAAQAQAARDEKDGAATATQQAAELDRLEARLFPRLHSNFETILTLKKRMLNRLYQMTLRVCSKPIRDKYQEITVVVSLIPELWNLVSFYAAEAPNGWEMAKVFPPTTFEQLLSEEERNFIGCFQVTSMRDESNIVYNPQFKDLLDEFHKENERMSQCWPYMRDTLDYWIAQGCLYHPNQLLLSRFTAGPFDPYSDHVYSWLRTPDSSIGHHVYDHDLFIEILNRLAIYPEDYFCIQVGPGHRTLSDEGVKASKAFYEWRRLNKLVVAVDSWKMVLRWIATLSVEKQQAWSNKLRNHLPVHMYRHYVRASTKSRAP